MNNERERRSNRLRSLVDRAIAKSDDDDARRSIHSEIEEVASPAIDELRVVLSRLLQANPNHFREVLTSFVGGLTFDPPLVDFIPFGRALDNDEGFFWDYRTLDEEFDLEKQRILALIGEGSAVAAFLATADMLCGLYGAYMQCDAALKEESLKYSRELAGEREREEPKVLGPIGAAVDTVKKLVSGKLLSPAEGDLILPLLDQARQRFMHPRQRLHRDPAPMSHRTPLGAELIRVFVVVGFNKRRGDYTKDCAAHFAVALASRFLIDLNPNTLRNVRFSAGTPA